MATRDDYLAFLRWLSGDEELPGHRQLVDRFMHREEPPKTKTRSALDEWFDAMKEKQARYCYYCGSGRTYETVDGKKRICPDCGAVALTKNL